MDTRDFESSFPSRYAIMHAARYGDCCVAFGLPACFSCKDSRRINAPPFVLEPSPLPSSISLSPVQGGSFKSLISRDMRYPLNSGCFLVAPFRLSISVHISSTCTNFLAAYLPLDDFPCRTLHLSPREVSLRATDPNSWVPIPISPCRVPARQKASAVIAAASSYDCPLLSG